MMYNRSMIDALKNVAKQEGYFIHDNNGISVVTVSDQNEGLDFAKKLLHDIVSPHSILYLSGGRTPKELYEALSKEERLHPGGVTLVDERYGEKFHKESNELMLKDTGLLRYLSLRDIPFMPILKGESREKTAEDFDQKLRELFAVYKQHIAVMGIGMDGHTAGIPADPSVWEEFHLKAKNKTEMAFDFDDNSPSAGSGFYGERVTMSFLGLSMMDSLLVLVFGDDKKRPVEWMFADGPEEQVPSRFFKRPDIAPKTILITDTIRV